MQDLNDLVWSTTSTSKQASQPAKQAYNAQISNLTSIQQGQQPQPMIQAQPSQSALLSGQPNSKAAKPKDPFANLMSGSALQQSKDQRSLSLSEQQQLKSDKLTSGGSSSPQNVVLSSQKVQQQASWNFDAFVDSKPSTNNTSPQAANIVKHDFDALDSFLSSPMASTTISPVKSAAKVQPELVKSQIVEDDDAFGLFSSNVVPSSKPVVDEDVVLSQRNVSATPIKAQTQSPILRQNAEPSSVKLQSPSVVNNSSVAIDKPSKEQQLEKMLQIGFSAKDSEIALDMSNGDMQAAINLMLNNPNFVLKAKGSTNQPSTNAQLKQLYGKAQVIGGGLFQKAKGLYADSSKIIGAAIANAAPNSTADTAFRRGSSAEQIQQQRASQQSIHELSLKEAAVAIPPPVVLKKERPQNGSLELSAIQAILTQVEDLKNKGTVIFKSGQYGDAEELYTKAISQLQQLNQSGTDLWFLQHPVLSAAAVPLLNNRAACRLKTGLYNEAVADASLVLAAVKEELEFADPTSSIKELEDAMAKALLRRATAYENMEKWSQAYADYQECTKASKEQGNSVSKNVSDGMRRCQKAIAPPPTNSTVSQSLKSQQSKIQTKTQQPIISVMSDLHSLSESPQHPQAAVDKQPQTQSQTKESLEIKDRTDAIIARWRDGKGQNIRALLSTLDQILSPYPSILSNNGGWKTPQMSELVTTSQVKIRYMKAIAKVHPDKVGQCSAEEMLICQSIFSSLNSAWDQFKIQNKM